MSEDETNVLLDRCPADFLGYISVHAEAENFDLDEWLPRVRVAVQTLDLIVFAPIETRDRIAFSPSDDDEETRAAVDEKLREILVDDSLDLAVEVLEVEGGSETRVSAVMERVARSDVEPLGSLERSRARPMQLYRFRDSAR